jgi:NAD(P)-dependent dehydrogenase (short-subunit alcohol dehydrogenase family)
MTHPALAAGRVAVITGGASGIGLATAQRLAGIGMTICIADIDEAALDAASASIAKCAGDRKSVIAIRTDVSRLEDVQLLKDKVYSSFGEVAFLMNNAGTEGGGQLFGDPARWQRIIGVNLWGVINGIQTFVPAMRAQGTDCAIVNTGSKQGITCPPGDTAYNVSKAGIKVVTEALAHDLRNINGCRVSAHLLIPGFTFTGFTRVHTQTKPDAAWTPDQVVDFMLKSMEQGDFYILCPDNSVTREVDELRMRWAMDDIIENRPPLSRWHPDFKEAFARFLNENLVGKGA